MIPRVHNFKLARRTESFNYNDNHRITVFVHQVNIVKLTYAVVLKRLIQTLEVGPTGELILCKAHLPGLTRMVMAHM